MRFGSLETRARVNGNSLDGQWIKENESKEIDFSNYGYGNQDVPQRPSLLGLEVIDDEDRKNARLAKESYSSVNNSESSIESLKNTSEKLKAIMSEESRRVGDAEIEKFQTEFEQWYQDWGNNEQENENELSSGRTK